MISEVSPCSANSTFHEEMREPGKGGFPSDEKLAFV